MPAPAMPSLIWEGHRAGMEIGYCHLEKLHNLEALPATGFMVCCFPFSIKGASAGFTRAVAILEDWPLMAADHILPTTVVGSYPQPEWLIDRELLGTMVPRVRMPEIWRVPEAWLEQAQDDATLLAIRDMERAGIDIITDGEMRRESYSNRFATALDGVDIDNPATITGRSRQAEPGAADLRADPAPAPGRGARRRVPAPQHRADDQDHPARAVHHVAPGQERVLRRRGGARDGLRRGGQRGGPRPQAGRRRHHPARRALDRDRARCRRALRAPGDRARLRRRAGNRRRCTCASAMPSSCTTRAGAATRSWSRSPTARRPDLDRGGAAQARSRRAEGIARQTVILGVLDLGDPAIESARGGGRADPQAVSSTCRRSG